jgi:hypothetical protein
MPLCSGVSKTINIINSNRKKQIISIGGDPFFSSVSLLLHMDGTNGSTTFTDSSSNGVTVTAVGDAQVDTITKQFGTGSCKFDGSGDYLDIAASSLLSFPGDFTVEFWGLLSDVGLTSYQAFIEIGTFANGILIRSQPGMEDVYVNNVFIGQIQSHLTSNVFSHIAMSRSGTSLKVFVDGITRITATVSGTINSGAAAARIGRARYTSGEAMTGFVDEVRITKGVARYTANFTPPTAPFLE